MRLLNRPVTLTTVISITPFETIRDEKNNISLIFATANDRFDEISADADDPNSRYRYN